MATFIDAAPATRAAYEGWRKHWINGSWRTGKSRHVVKDVDLFTGETLLEIPAGDTQDLDAHRGARAAGRAWAADLPSQRASALRGVAAIVVARREEIVSWLVGESGSTGVQARLEWESTHAIMLVAASMPYLVEDRMLPGDVPGKECRVYRQPAGVVGLISPWNWPLHLNARSLGPALAVGNAVVVKRASDTPVTGRLLLAKMFEEAGLAAGGMSVLVGAGREIGDAFVVYQTPRVISFTGSTAVGRRIARQAVESPIMKRLELELGGNTPFVVLSDADLDQATEAAVFGKFLHQGQIWMAINRLIIDGRVYNDFRDRFTERVRKLKYGDPNQSDTMVGPIINHSQLQHLRKHIEDARSAGTPQVLGGEPRGLVLPPHVFRDVGNEHPIARDELFGPVAPVLRAKGDEDALCIANSTENGLSSTVFTGDPERRARFAERLEAGMSHVRRSTISPTVRSTKRTPASFTSDHWVTLQHTPARYPCREQDVKGPSGRRVVCGRRESTR
jgi:aldehyde dehydrogenase (NAD+)